VHPIKLAIIGSGPSAFYAATRALTTPAPISAVHIYEALPTPFGLVRAGVAPDHPDVKNVTHRFTEVVRSASASALGSRHYGAEQAGERGGEGAAGAGTGGAGTFRFFGNVRVVAGPSSRNPAQTGGTALELPLQELLRHYTHIILAYGSAGARTLGTRVGGQELGGVCSALDFVNWYNGHPDAHTPAGSEGGRSAAANPWLDVIRPDARHVSVIGAGNVALDVARILLRARTPTSTFLAGTDIPSPVLSRLADTRVEHVSIVARRGVAQVAFTNKEVREMLTLGESEGIDFVPLSKESGELALDDVARLKQLSDSATRSLKAGEFGSMEKETFTKHASELAGELRIRKRLVDLLIKGSKAPKPDAAGHRKSWSLEPFRAPEAILPSTSSASGEGSTHGRGYVGQIRWSVTEPVPSSSNSSADASPSPAPTSPLQTPTWGGGSPPQTTEPQWGSVRPTGNTTTTDTDSVVYSLGYVGAPLPLPSSSSEASKQNTSSQTWQNIIPFDHRRGVIKNEKGTVEWDSEAIAQLGLNENELPHVYTTGWIGRGPVGVIATTMYDAYDTVDLMLSRASSAKTSKKVPDPTAPPALIQDALFAERIGQSPSERRAALKPSNISRATGAELGIGGLAGSVVEWEDWEIVDEFEREAGAVHVPGGKEREKVLTFT
ncbi:hypothetical protein CF328_g4079, partial [Tilletia controversa]